MALSNRSNTLSPDMRIEHTSPPFEEEASMNFNGSWSGTIGLLQRSEADISLLAVPMEHELLDVVKFETYSANNFLVIFSKRRITSTQGDILNSFILSDYRVYIVGLLATLTVYASGKIFDSARQHWFHKQEQKPEPNPVGLVATLFDQGVTKRFKSWSGIVLASSFLMVLGFLQFFTLSYLSTDLVVLEETVITNLEDVLKDPENEPYILNTSDIFRVFKEASEDSVWYGIWKRILLGKGKSLSSITDPSVMQKAAADFYNGDYTAIGEMATIFRAAQGLCQTYRDMELHLEFVPFDSALKGIPYRKTVEPRKALSLRNFIRTGEESGILNFLWEDIRGPVPVCASSSTNNEAKSIQAIGFLILQRVFSTWAILMAMNSLCLVGEILHFKATHKK